MKIQNYKISALILIFIFILNGCSLYKKMIIPTPYYPSGDSSQQETIVSQSSDNGIIEAQSDVNKDFKEQIINKVKEDNVVVKNKTVVQRIPFPESEYKSLAITGSATVAGHIYLKTSNGQKVYGKLTRLYLNPVTSYSTQWYKESYLGGAKMSKVDPRLFNYIKFTTSDRSGKFEFLNVPSGSYYLIGVVKCGKECGYNSTKSIRITKKISVFGSDIKSVDLSKSIN